MATRQINEVILALRRILLLREVAGLTDGQLLADYLDRRDETALAVLVQRHAPMVWKVCRWVVGNHHDAEDAFQATFLVFARKAHSIAKKELPANWLYGVARQTALRARTMAAKRRQRERQVTALPETAAAEPERASDLQPLLDRELGLLPERYRAVLLLCDLEGKTREEASRCLGCPEGTVGSRLARARIMLAKRLARHGVGFSAGVVAAVLQQNASSACVPAPLVGSTVKAATALAARKAAAATMVSAEVAALTQGVVKTMLLKKLQVAALMVAAACLIGLGGTVHSRRTLADERHAQQKAGSTSEAKAAATPKTDKEKPVDYQIPIHASQEYQIPLLERPPNQASVPMNTAQIAEPGRIFLTRQHDPGVRPSVGDNEPHLAMVSPDGKEDTWLTKNLTREEQPHHCGAVSVSPDGRLIAYGVTPKDEYGKPFHNQEIFLKAVDKDDQKPGESLKVRGLFWCWSPDGRSLVVSVLEGTSIHHQIVDIVSKKTKSIRLPEAKGPENAEFPTGHLITDWSRDGKWFLTTVMAKGQAEAELYLVKSEGSQAKCLGVGFGGKLAPDAKTVLCLDLTWTGEKGDTPDTHLLLIDVETKKRRRVSQETNGQFVGACCWSPDGKKIAYVWRRDRDNENQGWETFLMVMDADGQNSRVVLSEKSSRTNNWCNPFGCPDWR
jgi:RNA polymerase sigma factor (sigma-70 family)